MDGSTPRSRARCYLEHNLKHSWHQGMRLPTLRALAMEAGVGICTMAAALKKCAEQGVLSVERRGGIHVGCKPVRENAPGPKRTGRHESVTARILHDVSTGTFPPDTLLPSIKLLGERYGTGYRTIRHAMDALVEQGLLAAHRRSVIVRRQLPHRHGSPFTILMNAGYKRWSGWEFAEGKFPEFAHGLEVFCANNGMALDYREIEPDTSRLPTLNNPAAIAIFAWFSMDHLDQLTTQAQSYGVPVIIINAGYLNTRAEIQHALGKHLKSPLTFIVNFSNFGLGKTVGDYLLSLGHQKICYFADARRNWRVMRLMGVQKSYESLGSMAKVSTYFSADDLPEATAKTDLFSKDLVRFRSMLEESTAALNAHQVSEPFEQYRKSILERMQETAYYLELPQRFHGIFSRAAGSDATAWVVSDNYFAVYGGVLKFLRERRIRVPRDLSVISIGNFSSSLYQNLTTCDDNFGLLMPLLMSIALNPNYRATIRRKGGSIDIAARIIARGTCRSVGR